MFVPIDAEMMQVARTSGGFRTTQCKLLGHTIVFPAVGILPAGSVAAGLAGEPAIFAVILSRKDSFPADTGAAGISSGASVSGCAAAAGGAAAGAWPCSWLKENVDLPPGAASTRDDGRSPRKFPTFCPSA
jgi:hypothetical protein